MSRPTCESCAAFNFMGEECRRHSPTAIPVTKSDGKLTVGGAWPPVVKSQWCGEWIAELPAISIAKAS